MRPESSPPSSIDLSNFVRSSSTDLVSSKPQVSSLSRKLANHFWSLSITRSFSPFGWNQAWETNSLDLAAERSQKLQARTSSGMGSLDASTFESFAIRRAISKFLSAWRTSSTFGKVKSWWSPGLLPARRSSIGSELPISSLEMVSYQSKMRKPIWSWTPGGVSYGLAPGHRAGPPEPQFTCRFPANA